MELSSSEFIAVTTSDTVALSYNSIGRTTKGIACAVTGNIACKNSLGTSVTHYCVAGVIYPIRATLIMTTNTTATGIVAYF